MGDGVTYFVLNKDEQKIDIYASDTVLIGNDTPNVASIKVQPYINTVSIGDDSMGISVNALSSSISMIGDTIANTTPQFSITSPNVNSNFNSFFISDSIIRLKRHTFGNNFLHKQLTIENDGFIYLKNGDSDVNSVYSLITIGETSITNRVQPNAARYVQNDMSQDQVEIDIFNGDTVLEQSRLRLNTQGLQYYYQSSNIIGLETRFDITPVRLEYFDWGVSYKLVQADLENQYAVIGDQSTVSIEVDVLNQAIKLTGLPTFADNAAASSLATNQVYKTATGELRIKY